MTARTEEQLREAVLAALEETERLSAFVNAMLQLSQAESGQLALRIEQQDLCLAAQEVLDQLKTPAEEARRRLVAELPARCLADVDRLQFNRLLSKEHLPHIFERFYRAPSTDSSDMRGLGLGLSFVEWIVKAHCGTIDVRSSVGQGSRFVVTLPRSAARLSAIL